MLIDIDETPLIFRRHHIIRAYRPLHQSTYYYLTSAFKSNNETLNFWSHFLPSLFIGYVFLIPELLNEGGMRFPLILLYTGIIFLFLCSSFSHLLHSKCFSSHVYFLILDFLGISTFSICTGIQRYLNSKSMGPIYDFGYIPLLLFASLGLQFTCTSYLFVCAPHWKFRLPLKMVSSFSVACFIYVPLMQRYYDHELDDATIHIHTKALFWLVLSGVFMVMKIPERFAPGLFDVVGYGHQLFHVCIFMVTWNLCEASRQDNNLLEEPLTISNFLKISVLLVLLLVFALYCKVMSYMMAKIHSSKITFSQIEEESIINNCCGFIECYTHTIEITKKIN
uniref:Progestin and adipoQ receptor family member 3-like n=1 Tax=Rhabditophanes sp. KR3021 TaxID=114890 RepID=A0AC35TTG3_9BILA